VLIAHIFSRAVRVCAHSKYEKTYCDYKITGDKGMRRAPNLRGRKPEITSGAKRLIRLDCSIVEREKLAQEVEKLALEAFGGYEQSLKKLTELRPMIAQLREVFMKLKPSETVAGCRTWTEYCERVLHRSDRRIRQILKGANPASEKHSRKSSLAQNDLDALPEPKTVEVPEPSNAEWTLESVVEMSFEFVYSVFQKARLSDEEHNQAVTQLIDRLRHDVLLGD
jgi:hypothetical protein